jgi:hypothetical protein
MNSSPAASLTHKKALMPRCLLIIFVLIGSAAGLTPLAFFLGRTQLLLYYPGATALMALIYMGDVDRLVLTRPSLQELLIAQVASIFMGAVFGAFSLLLYGLIYGLLGVVGWAVGLLHWNWGINPSTIAFYCVVVFLVLPILACGADGNEVIAQLFPAASEEVSGFRTLIARRPGRAKGTVLIASLLLVASIVCFIVWRDRHPWVFVVFQFALMFTSQVARPPRSGIYGKGKRADTAAVVGDVFRMLDYSIAKPQKTGQSAVDPFLTDIDWVATGPQQKYLVQVNAMGGETTSGSWRNISGLRMACLVLADQEKSTPIEPLLVLLDASPDKALLELARREKVHVFEIRSSEVEDIRKSPSADVIKGIAGRLKSALAETSETVANK